MPDITPERPERLTEILNLALDMRAMQQAIEAEEADLKAKKERFRQLSEDTLPQMMMDLGLTDFTLTNGMKLKIKPEYYGSVAQTRMFEAVNWLAAHNMAGIVDKKITVNGDEAMLAELRRQNFDAEMKCTIHPSRLKAFVRERIEANDPEFPRELFAASQVNRAVLLAE